MNRMWDKVIFKAIPFQFSFSYGSFLAKGIETDPNYIYL